MEQITAMNTSVERAIASLNETFHSALITIATLENNNAALRLIIAETHTPTPAPTPKVKATTAKIPDARFITFCSTFIGQKVYVESRLDRWIGLLESGGIKCNHVLYKSPYAICTA